ncbi:glycosyltransferase [Lutibacter citreus]|uniref:glycosyltransferase n=1 Tax=Lutibacter citreus TaxID=2138210 RepID=UPI000DBE7C5B|nr:glycosyltransferase [Lutibacter citreus]
MKELLIIGFVWPEPDSTAAGTRMLQLIELFKKNNFNITFACAAAKTKNSFKLENIGVSSKDIELNNSSFNEFIKSLKPNIVIFDRYLTEEQFGWRVSEECPNTIKILDTEDLHFLRKSRELSLKNNNSTNNLFNEVTKREIASIYRCDLTLIISKYEMKILTKAFSIKKSILIYLPFLLNTINPEKNKTYPSFKERKHFISIGNFKHEPNWNAVLHLKNNIWPLIREQLPKAQLHIYGAYCTEKVLQLHKESEGFIIKGRAENLKETFINARVCLAPIRFGAGLKGKLINSMEYGTPNVTTNSGVEGMKGKLPWNGFISNNNEDFAQKAVSLYTNENYFEQFQQNGINIINKRFSKIKFEKKLINRIILIEKSLKLHRDQNFIGSMLLHHTLKSTKYMSKWIEEKNKN